MDVQKKYSQQRITDIRFWTPSLLSIKTERPAALQFIAGQFVPLGLPKEDGSLIWRAYSFVSGPTDDHLEFYSIIAPDGEFSPQLATLKVGDMLLVEHNAYGFLTLERFTGGQDLWMMATGTGLAPFISILRDPIVWSRFQHIFIVHSARHAQDLTYADLLTHFQHDKIDPVHLGKLHYIPTLTREEAPGMLHGRITTLLSNGVLERTAKTTLNHENSRIMVCGNPEMVKDTRKLLTKAGYTVSRTATPGPLVLENQWKPIATA
ncbi:ferredoxin--NADP reductase [Candidatus Pandoraea novymonadis]|uniref:ferredoxin--NADP(+) reductase n=1 Tax=Candidatus Pandoraea novymonadis TaxID=1808959 RepID=A0ABX5FEV4_9BURK|nr:ferredoxin--NADP reductase [Candidatus Pandoraea novymonadis]PSB92229.1 Ferredoxin--NADP reductase [Candidatus Pandoraea novymonadis]